MSRSNSILRTEWTPERVANLSKTITFITIAGILLGSFAVIMNLYYVAACIAAALLVFLIGWKFEAALMVYMLVAFVPWGKTPTLAVGGSGAGKGIYISELMVSFLIGIWIIKYILRNLPKNRPSTGFYKPLILYIAYSILNVVHSFIFWDPNVNKIYQYPIVNFVELGLRFLSAGALVIVATSITDKKWLKWTTIAIMIPGFYNLINALIGTKLPFTAPWWPLLTILPVTYCWISVLDTNKKLAIRLICLLAVASAFFIIGFKGINWVSGWLAVLASLALATYCKDKKLFKYLSVFALLAVVMFMPFIQKHIITPSIEEGDMDRLSLFSGALKYATTFPLGVGLGNYRTYNSFHYGELWGTTSYTSAHGTYSQHLSEMGIPGLILFLCILIGGYRWMSAKQRKLPEGISKQYLLAAMGQLFGISCAALIGDYIIPTYHNGGIVTFSTTVYSWLAWGLAIAHVRINEQTDLVKEE